MNSSIWSGQRVFLTGHTGFKGAWLATILRRAGAEVYGFALPPATTPSLFTALGLERDMYSTYGDIRDRAALDAALRESRAGVVFHLAAQPLVRRAYREPVTTYETNVMGTVQLLDLCLASETAGVVVVATTDKCYANDESGRPFREDASLGGHDPYSASKAAVEIAVASYRDSYFKAAGKHLATIRAGNVIGGGDWSEDRLIPDIVRAAFDGTRLVLRNPQHVRPWQHVLDALAGYIAVAERAVRGENVDEAWNIGPEHEASLTVEAIAHAFIERSGALPYEVEPSELHEAATLILDVTKARERLGISSQLTAAQALEYTVDWYSAYYRGSDIRSLTIRQIDSVFS